MTDAEQEAVLKALWECYVQSGVDRDGKTMDWYRGQLPKLANDALAGVRDLRKSYDECLGELP